MERAGTTCGLIRTTTRLTFPVVLVFAGEHIVNASIAPGEGFSGGLLTALSVLLLYVGVGYERTERDLPIFGRLGLLAGIALALVTGFVGLAKGAFLSSFDPVLTLLASKVHVSTHLLFDLAIFLVVCSGALAIFRAIGAGEESP